MDMSSTNDIMTMILFVIASLEAILNIAVESEKRHDNWKGRLKANLPSILASAFVLLLDSCCDFVIDDHAIEL